jgi:Cu/Ag efflux protein CusF
MSNLMKSLMLALSLIALPAFAQQAPLAVEVSSSTPGKAFMAESVKASAIVTGIDKATRTVTLKGPKGNVFDVVAGDEVKNFEQIKIKDEVIVTYVQALSLEVRKGSGIRERSEGMDAASAAPGQKPAAAVGRHVTVLADVIAVSKKHKTITLKGPKGNVVVLDVKNPDHFKVVKKGDQVEADYVEAMAISVEPAKK